MIRGVPAQDYIGVRNKVAPFLRNFEKRSRDGITVQEIESDILRRDRQLWVIGDFQAVGLTQVTRDAVRVTHLAGVRRHEWQAEAMDHLNKWAKALGKKYIIILGRPGWSASLRDRGYREIHREMLKEI